MKPFIVNNVDFTITNLIDVNERFCNSVSINVAKAEAKEAGLDLVCFNKPNGQNLALCKIIDYGKWKYRQDKIEKKEKQHSKKETKEVRFSPVIGEHDIEHKIKQVIEFLQEGDDVLITMRFKGVHHRLKDDGNRIIKEILVKCKNYGKELHRKQDNDNICVRMVKVE